MLSHIFRSYDIRGVYGKDIDEAIAEKIGISLALKINGDIAVARDMRLSSERIMDALIKGIRKGGRDVYFLGLVPLGPAMYFSWKNGKYLAYVTASHLPKEWAGVKFFHPDGCGFIDKENYGIRDTFMGLGAITHAEQNGKLMCIDDEEIQAEYKQYLLGKIQAKKKRIVLDCGNGMAGMIVKDLFESAGFDVTILFEELDGSFPNRDSEPNDESLTGLKKAVIGKDFGIAFDGDGDRMVFVDDTGKVATPEQIAYILLGHLLKKGKRPVVANVECSRIIDTIVKKFSASVYRVQVGHPYIVKEAARRKACLGIETSGHYVLPDLFPFDDAIGISLYAAALLSNNERKLSELIRSIPAYPFRRINFECADDKKFAVIKNLEKAFSKTYKNISTLDGVRVDFKEGWVLARVSNTSPLIRLTMEAENEKEFKRIEKEFSKKVGDAITSS